MQNVTSTELSRDCDAVQIPHGAALSLPKGTPVDITQTLGGTFTVHAHGGLYRIAGKDADALGLPVPVEEKKVSSGPVTLDEKEVWEILRSCYDPEIPVNIVDLGLVYEIDLHDNGDVDIQYSLTTMGCPIGPLIEDQMRAFLAPIEGLGEVRPELVFRPAWSPEMMSDEAKAALGIF